jgi:hypothetical protein
MLVRAGDGLAEDVGSGQCDESFGEHLAKSWESLVW